MEATQTNPLLIARIALCYKVMEDMLEGLALLKALKKHGISPQVFQETLAKDKEAALAYARCREIKADLLADQTIEIADSEDNPAKAANQIKARQWFASKVAPKTYGDRIDLNVSQTLDIAGTLALAQQRLRPINDLQQPVAPYVIDSSCVIEARPTDTQSALPGANAIPDIFD